MALALTLGQAPLAQPNQPKILPESWLCPCHSVRRKNSVPFLRHSFNSCHFQLPNSNSRRTPRVQAHSFRIPPAIRGGLTSLAKSNPIPILCPQKSHKFPRRRASAVRVKQKSRRPSVPPGHFTTCFCIAFPPLYLLSKVMGFGAVASTDVGPTQGARGEKEEQEEDDNPVGSLGHSKSKDHHPLNGERG